MLLKPATMMVFLYFKLCLGNDTPLDIIDLVSDLILKENRPTNIVAYVCWTKHVNLQMVKRFSDRSYFTTLGDTGNIKSPALQEHQMFLIDMSCVGSKKILNQAQQLKLFSKPFRWIIWGTEENSLSEFYFGVDSRVFFITPHGIEYRVTSLYKPAENSNKFWENYVATWKRKEGFLEYKRLYNLQSRSDLMGTELTVSYVATNPDTLNHLSDYRDREIDSITKVNWVLLHHVLDCVNATSIGIYRDTWGYKNVTTSLYSGLMGDLQTGRAEIGGTPSFFTIDRIDVVDYIAATTRSYRRFIFRAPPLSYETNIFTLPFDTYVWYSSFLLVVVILAVLYVIVFWESKDNTFRKKTAHICGMKPNITDVFLLEVGAITQHGTDATGEPRSSAGRIATIITFISLMFLYTSYSANIVGLLQTTTESIKTLEDLYNSGLSLGVHDIVYARYYFQNAQDPLRKKIYQKVAPKGQKDNFMSVLEGMKRVQEGFFAFHLQLSAGYKVIADIFQESEKCSLREVVYSYLMEPGMNVRKRSPYKTLFKVGLLRLHEYGIQHREVFRVYRKKPVCRSTGSFGSAGLIDCYGAFLIFGIGVACSALLFSLEILIKRYNDRKENNRVLVVSLNNFTNGHYE